MPETRQVSLLRPSFLLTLAHQTDGLRTLCLDCSHHFFRVIFASKIKFTVKNK